MPLPQVGARLAVLIVLKVASRPHTTADTVATRFDHFHRRAELCQFVCRGEPRQPRSGDHHGSVCERTRHSSSIAATLHRDLEHVEELMSLNRNDEAKSSKKDPTVRRETLDELEEATDRPEIGSAEARYRKLNRDQSRGDWDRSQRLDE